MQKSNRILVVAPERWDEACFALPAVRALVASGLEVEVLCGGNQEHFWKSVEGIEVGGGHGKGIEGQWDAALAWEHGAMAKAIRAAGVARCIAPRGERKLEKWATDALDAKVGVLEHRVRYYLATVEALGVATRDARFFAPADGGGEVAADRVMLCPDSDFGPSHEWALERWVELARWLRDEMGMRLTVASMERGRGLVGKLCEAVGKGVEAFDAGALGAAMPIFSKHRLVVAADGSLPHVAAHAGAKCVVLFGPNDPVWRRPLGKQHAVVKYHAECAPCLMAKCPLDMRCQTRLEVETVVDAVRIAM